MRLSCAATELLMERQSPALSHAERLRVESHLNECEDCRREHGAMLQLIQLVDDRVESAAKPGVQDRAIARALLRAKAPETAALPAAASFAWPRLAWGLGLAAMLAVGLALSLRTRKAVDSAPVVAAALGDRVKSGALLLGDHHLAAGQAVPQDRELRASGPLELQLAHASLAIEKTQTLRWSAAERTVELSDGVVEAEVDPTKHQTFRIVLPNFVVDVLGTHFRVAHDTVSVDRGRVRITSRARQTLAELGPGQSWTYQPAPAAATPAAEAAALAPPSNKPAGTSSDAAPAPSAEKIVPAELLARARHRLASGDAKAARQDLERLLASGASRSQQAEAYMLEGDCALVQGDHGGAVRQYLEVRQRFAGTRFAETALFAAARVESNRGSKAAAKRLLLEYRDLYPQGQFSSDVDARLKLLQ